MRVDESSVGDAVTASVGGHEDNDGRRYSVWRTELGQQEALLLGWEIKQSFD